MDFADLKNKADRELNELLASKRDELRELRFKANERQLKNVRAIRKIKKTVARILTILNKKKGTGTGSQG